MFRPPCALTASPADEAATMALLAACYGAWALVTAQAAAMGMALAIPLTALTVTLHSSLQHEILHGHPFRSPRLNAALAFPALGLFVPYARFRDTHIAHHRDARLTDPYDDPESNFLDPAAWARLSRPMRALLRANNTLLGRMALGPALSIARLCADDLRAMRRGEAGVTRAWALHAGGVAVVALWLAQMGAMPAWAYLASAYLGFSILKIRTFLEHRAHPDPAARTVVVEDRGVLAFLFLNNNFHAVHHAAPQLSWRRLPAAYATDREAVLERNDGYRYPSYLSVLRRHLLTAKDPVPHPLRPEADR